MKASGLFQAAEKQQQVYKRVVYILIMSIKCFHINPDIYEIIVRKTWLSEVEQFIEPLN